jgi:hypothetical protein
MAMRRAVNIRLVRVFALFLFSIFAENYTLLAQLAPARSESSAASVALQGTATDLGPVPASQMVTFQLRWKTAPDRISALEEFIAEQQTAGSANYRHWLTPDEFGTKFGATDDQIAAAVAWVERRGLQPGAISTARNRLTVMGSADRVQAVTGVRLRLYQSGSARYLASSPASSAEAASSPAAPAAGFDAIFSGVSSLEAAPLPRPITIAAFGQPASSQSTATDALSAAAQLIDANLTSIVIVSTEACSSDLTQSEIDDFRSLFRQAEAQGITVLSSNGCGAVGMESFPAVLPEVTAVATTDSPSTNELGGLDARPGWQFATGLPDSGLRASPDVAVASVTSLAQTLLGVAKSAGTRLGNVAPELYALVKTPGLYTQPDGGAAGEWQGGTGLGLVDLDTLAKVFPRGLTGTSSLLTVSNYAPTHGSALTLTATVTTTGAPGIPTGTVTFTSTQKGTLGTAVLNPAGVATFSTNSLAGGTYTVTSVYGGDGTFTGSTSGTATITVVGEPSIITATVSPGAVVGGEATISVTVTSGSGVGTPSGTVTVAPQGTLNATTASATLAGADGVATATVLLPVSQQGTFTLLVSCTDSDPSFTCNSPIDVPLTVGTATATLSASFSPSSSVPYGTNVALIGTATFPTAAQVGPLGSLVAVVSGSSYTGTLAQATGTSSTATFNLPVPVPGSYPVQVSCPASDSFLCSAPATITLTTVRGSTATTLSLNPVVPVAGQTTTLTATISNTGGGTGIYSFTGTVAFYANSKLLGTGVVTGVQASIPATLTAGSLQNVTAVYSGDDNWNGSTSLAQYYNISGLSSTTVVTSSATNVLAGVQVVLTATVTGAILNGVPANLPPSGAVIFYDSYNGGLSQLGSGTLTSAGGNTSQATLNVLGLGSGNHNIYAIYSGDTIYLPSTSPTLVIAFTGFSVTFVPSTLTVTQGQTGSASLLVNYGSGFAGTVAFGCTPPPNVELTCSFNPAVLSGGGTTTLTVATLAPHSVKSRHEQSAIQLVGGLRGLGGGAMLALLAICIRPRSLRIRLPLLLILLAVATSALGGCTGTNNAGSSTTPPSTTPSDPGSALGTQILDITTAGSDGVNTVRHDFQYQVTVQ